MTPAGRPPRPDRHDEVISSTHHPRVVAARKLHQRKERDAAGAFLAEGPHAAAAALAAGQRLRELFVTPAAADREVDLLRAAARADVPLSVVSEPVAAALAETRHPQGVIAVVGVPSTDLAAVLAARPRLLVVLVAAADPGNVGTVIRTADAAGADAVILTAGSADPFAGKVVRASAGSVFHLPVVTGVDPGDVVPLLRAAGLATVATTLDGDDLDAAPDALRGPTAWLFGNEAHGLPPDLAAAADRRVRIPLHGRAESLNLAAAAAVCLYASARSQRR